MGSRTEISRRLPLLLLLPMTLLGSGVCLAQDTAPEGIKQDDIKLHSTVQEDIEQITVKAVRQREAFERRDIRVGSDRFFKGPWGNPDQIIRIGQELKNRGEKKRIFTRGIKMPQTYASSSVDRYNYSLADDCGIEKFNFYEGDDFRALGLVYGDKEWIFDVLTGGGPFTGPGIWGPYDQIVGRRHEMEPIMADASKDGLGLSNTGYLIGQKADLPSSEMSAIGTLYGDVLSDTAGCLSDKLNREAAGRVLSSTSTP